MVDDHPLSNKTVLFNETQDKHLNLQLKNDKYVLIDPIQNMLATTVRDKLFDSNLVFSKDIGISTSDLNGEKTDTEMKMDHYLARAAYEAVFTPEKLNHRMRRGELQPEGKLKINKKWTADAVAEIKKELQRVKNEKVVESQKLQEEQKAEERKIIEEKTVEEMRRKEELEYANNNVVKSRDVASNATTSIKSMEMLNHAVNLEVS